MADELLHLAIACDDRLREPGIIQRILRNDVTVCGRKNEESFHNMRNLLVAFFYSRGKAAERIGPQDTKKIIEAITERKKKLRDSDGNWDAPATAVWIKLHCGKGCALESRWVSPQTYGDSRPRTDPCA